VVTIKQMKSATALALLTVVVVGAAGSEPEQLVASAALTSPFAGMPELSADAVVEQTLARNPSLAQMTAAWQAVSARYRQVTALDDPMFGAMAAPPSFASNAVDPGYRIEISQKLPWCGKRRLRGQSALAEADAAGRDVDDIRLQLVESARLAFCDYYLSQQAIAVNDEGLRLLLDLRARVQTLTNNGLMPQQDLLQADVEIGRQRERSLTLERMRKVAIARINTLVHLSPESPLPPARNLPVVSDSLPPAEALRSRAIQERPDVKALNNRLQADQAALALARKEFYPDIEVMAAYDATMGNGPTRDLAPQVGIRINLPVRTSRRYAAIAEAEARLASHQAELDRLADQVAFQVQDAYEQVAESQQVIRLYEETILPAARKNVKPAQEAYNAGKTPFVTVIDVQRNLVMLRERSYEALADHFRRWANLERVIGGSLPR
jgi:outer membrane protein TolC